MDSGDESKKYRIFEVDKNGNIVNEMTGFVPKDLNLWDQVADDKNSGKSDKSKFEKCDKNGVCYMNPPNKTTGATPTTQMSKKTREKTREEKEESVNIELSLIGHVWMKWDNKQKREFLKSVPYANWRIDNYTLEEVYRMYSENVVNVMNEYDRQDLLFYKQHYQLEKGKIRIRPFRIEIDPTTSERYVNFGLFYNFELNRIEGPYSLYGLPIFEMLMHLNNNHQKDTDNGYYTKINALTSIPQKVPFLVYTNTIESNSGTNTQDSFKSLSDSSESSESSESSHSDDDSSDGSSSSDSESDSSDYKKNQYNKHSEKLKTNTNMTGIHEPHGFIKYAMFIIDGEQYVEVYPQIHYSKVVSKKKKQQHRPGSTGNEYIPKTQHGTGTIAISLENVSRSPGTMRAICDAKKYIKRLASNKHVLIFGNEKAVIGKQQ